MKKIVFPKKEFKKIKKHVENIIRNKRRALEVTHIQDMIKKKKKLGFIRDIIIDDEILLIKLQGSIDSSTIPLLDDKRSRRFRDYPNRHLILDFKKVKHIDSSTLASLTLMFSRLKANKRKIAIINATPDLRKYIKILHLKKIVKVYDSKKEAETSIR